MLGRELVEEGATRAPAVKVSSTEGAVARCSPAQTMAMSVAAMGWGVVRTAPPGRELDKRTGDRLAVAQAGDKGAIGVGGEGEGAGAVAGALYEDDVA